MSEEMFLMTHSYIYHPSLLTLDLGGGPVFENGSVDGDGFATKSKRQMINFNGRATVLRDKPYTGALFYDRHNQTQNIAPAQVILTENTRYGFNASLLSPLTPAPLHMELTRMENQGTGADQIIEDRIDQLRVGMDASVGKWGRSAFQYVGTRQDSLSGSSFLPIQASRSKNDNVNLDTRLKFGARNEYDLNNVVTYNANQFTVGQGNLTQLKDFRFDLDLRAWHSANLQSFARYNNNSSTQDEQEAKLNSASAGMTFQLNPELSGSLGARGEINKTTQLNSTLYGIDGSATYRRALPLGEASAGYIFAYTQRDQQAEKDQARVIGERVTLTGTTLATLGNDLIIASTLVVSNLNRTQTFVEGRDYVLTQIGLSLRIQRVIGGSILDGQEVLADYVYATGGTYAASRMDNTISLSWALKNYLSVYMRLLDSAPHLDSGTPTSPLNPVKSALYGTRAEVPLSLFSQELLLGGRAEREERRESISPYKSSSLDAFVQVDLPLVRNGNIRAATRRLQVDYDFSPAQGVNLVGYDLSLWARAGYGIDLSAEASHERDTGTPETRERSLLSAKAQWRKRKFLVTFDLSRVRDAQGASQRTRTYGQVMLRRDF
ncbi:MAG: hypothetical protein IH606_05745 [Burkholderiales bacterium]|nr:hypothetical protein [Burkholderiales bacterium]